VLVVKLRPELVGTTNGPSKDFMTLLRGEGAINLLCPYMRPVGAKPIVDCD
jgi:hypothetical protein